MPRRVPSHRVIARERVERLFELAEGIADERQRLADRYIELAWRMVKRYNLRLPPHLKRKFCRKCLSYLRPGVTSRVRVHPAPPRVVVTCLRCGHLMRFPHKVKR